MLVFLLFCAIGFSQNSQNQNKEIKAPSGSHARTVVLPGAYFNNMATTQGEILGVANYGQRNTNVTVPFTGTYYSNRPDAMIYDNGPYWNVAGTPNVSLLESATLGMNTLGSGAQFTGGNSVADDVVFAEDVAITSIDLFTYQTGATPPSITAVYMRVWDGDPSGGGANVIWGNLTTNILGTVVYADANRASETTPADTSRKIQRVTALTAGLALSAGTYWIEYTFEGSGSSGPWTPPIAILGQSTTGNALQNQSGTWIALEDGGTFTPQGLPFVIYGEITGGGGSFPDPYCAVEFSTVEPITLVEVAGISNRSSAVVNGSPAHEDFTAIVGAMEEGQSYSIALEGNTDGGFTCSFTVFIDWNQDGILDNASERYEIGTIVGSTGNDGQQATSTIVVPSGVTPGNTRMRVMKKFSAPYVVDSCTGTSFGQAEDYTITVTSGGGGCSPVSLQTLYAGGNNGAQGGAVYFDLTVADSDIDVLSFDLNTADTGNFTMQVYVFAGTYVGNQGNPASWGTAVATGSGTGAGEGLPSKATLDNPISMMANTTYAVALVFDSTHAHYYTNGDGGNQNYSNGDISLKLGSASNIPFSDPIFDPRVWNGSVEYCVTGGGTGDPCGFEHIVVGDGNGGSGSSVDSDYKSAADIVIAAGEKFTLDTIEVSFLTFAPEDAPVTADVVYYSDAAGLPGTEIGSETVVPTILSSAPWINPVAYRFDTRLDMTPFTFNGNAGSTTSYWVEISMGTATNQQTVFWLYTEGTGIEGQPMVQFNAADGFWSVPEPTREVGYKFSGECGPLSVADNALVGFTYYPNPTSGALSLKSVNNIESVAFYNLLGQKVLDTKIGATTSEINLSALNTGTYIMKVSIDGQIGTYKILKN